MSDEKKKFEYVNHLFRETSPYLLMHAHNPVDWHPWCDEAFEKARRENKLVIISIGYAACHWCHVMEEKSFSDPEVAEVMNDSFISIKVDREERPDIDQIYMDACQLVTGSGGWPLNAIALPDGRPVYAGTYFSKEGWISLLSQINKLYKEKPYRLEENARAIIQGIKSSAVISLNQEKTDFVHDHLNQIFEKLEKIFDFHFGGLKGAPKFPIPVIYEFLVKYFYMNKKSRAMDAVEITLKNMALGGIYDQLGGGFARYSTDENWKVPHFEKMLYDNAQLISLYSRVYRLTKSPLYKKVVFETINFIERELTFLETPSGNTGFYSSIDADSDGEEGKFYSWTEEGIKKLLGNDFGVIREYFNVSENGNWEKGKNVLYRSISDKEFAEKKKMSLKELEKVVARSKKKLFEARIKRTRPSMDDKILCSWNAMMLTGYVDAYRAFAQERFLKNALKSAEFIVKNLMSEDGRLDRKYKKGKSSINAFLDDYAFTVKAFISLYQVTFDEKWIMLAKKLMEYSILHFFDDSTGMFYYTSDLDPKLINRKIEITDNVIPSSNSVMAENLYLLGVYFFNDDYKEKSRQMLKNVKEYLLQYPASFAN